MLTDTNEVLVILSALIADLDQPLAFLGIPGSLRHRGVASPVSVAACTQTGHSSVALMHAAVGSACSWPLAASSSLFQALWAYPSRSVKHPV